MGSKVFWSSFLLLPLFLTAPADASEIPSECPTPLEVSLPGQGEGGGEPSPPPGPCCEDPQQIESTSSSIETTSGSFSFEGVEHDYTGETGQAHEHPEFSRDHFAVVYTRDACITADLSESKELVIEYHHASYGSWRQQYSSEGVTLDPGTSGTIQFGIRRVDSVSDDHAQFFQVIDNGTTIEVGYEVNGELSYVGTDVSEASGLFYDDITANASSLDIPEYFSVFMNSTGVVRAEGVAGYNQREGVYSGGGDGGGVFEPYSYPDGVGTLSSDDGDDPSYFSVVATQVGYWGGAGATVGFAYSWTPQGAAGGAALGAAFGFVTGNIVYVGGRIVIYWNDDTLADICGDDGEYCDGVGDDEGQ